MKSISKFSPDNYCVARLYFRLLMCRKTRSGGLS